MPRISRVSDQNGASPLYLYIMLEIHHSGREPSIYSDALDFALYPLSTTRNVLNIWIYKTNFCHYLLILYTGVASGVDKFHKSHQDVKSEHGIAALGKAHTCFTPSLSSLPEVDRLVGLMVKASASRAEGPRFESRLRRDFFGVESYQWLQNWHSSGYPARRLALWGQHWDWSARCQYTVTEWGRTLDLQLLSQCGST